MRFYRPLPILVGVTVSVRPLAGYTTETAAKIQQNVRSYINALNIGDTLTISALWGVALSAMPDLTAPKFSVTGIKAKKLGGSWADNDLTLGFRDVFVPDDANISVSES
jgi:hypothetical protein